MSPARSRPRRSTTRPARRPPARRISRYTQGWRPAVGSDRATSPSRNIGLEGRRNHEVEARGVDAVQRLQPWIVPSAPRLAAKTLGAGLAAANPEVATSLYSRGKVTEANDMFDHPETRYTRFVPLRSTACFARGTASALLLLKKQRGLQLSDRLR